MGVSLTVSAILGLILSGTCFQGLFSGNGLSPFLALHYFGDMFRRRRIPIALTIAGSDSGGGAGIQADLKTFASLNVHGTSVITCVTAQNPKELRSIEACKPAIISAQLSAIFAELPPSAVKIGMLFSPGIVSEVVKFFSRRRQRPPLIVDPVMVATSKARLVERQTIQLLKEMLLPIATLVTPNLAETETLLGLPIREPEDLREAARLIQKHFRCAALVKGGHFKNCKDAVDIFYDGRTELLLTAPFIRGISTHGTGCTYSAAIAGYCARGCDLPHAVQFAKNYITQAIAQSVQAKDHTILNSFWTARH